MTQVFATQNFLIPGTNPAQYITGTYVIRNFFQLGTVNTWGMFFVVLAYVIFFRFNQYVLFAHQTDQLFINKNKDPLSSSKKIHPTRYSIILESDEAGRII